MQSRVVTASRSHGRDVCFLTVRRTPNTEEEQIRQGKCAMSLNSDHASQEVVKLEPSDTTERQNDMVAQTPGVVHSLVNDSVCGFCLCENVCDV